MSIYMICLSTIINQLSVLEALPAGRPAGGGASRGHRRENRT